MSIQIFWMRHHVCNQGKWLLFYWLYQNKQKLMNFSKQTNLHCFAFEHLWTDLFKLCLMVNTAELFIFIFVQVTLTSNQVIEVKKAKTFWTTKFSVDLDGIWYAVIFVVLISFMHAHLLYLINIQGKVRIEVILFKNTKQSKTPLRLDCVWTFRD